MKIQDHIVSNKWFSLELDPIHGYWMTRPQPSQAELPTFYPDTDYLSHRVAPRNFLERCYQFFRIFAILYKKNIVKSLKIKDKRLLDVGCGTGVFLKSMKNSGWQVLGVEPNKQARFVANDLTENAVFDNDQLLAWKNSSFDVITLWHVLEHLPDLDMAISNLNRLLDDSGKLVVALPNHLSFDANYYSEGWAAYDVPRHLWHFSKDSLSSLMRTYGFQLIATKPLWLDAYYIALMSESYRSSNLRWLRAIWLGTLSNLSAIFTGEFSSIIYIFKRADR